MQIQLLPKQAYLPFTRAVAGERAALCIESGTPRAPDCYAVRIVLDRINIAIFVAANPTGTDGTFRSTQRIERQGDDSVHVHVVDSALSHQLGLALSRAARPEALSLHPQVARDPAIERLARALFAIEDVPGSFDEAYANAVSVAIVTRIISLHARSASHGVDRIGTGLQTWRLKRVVNHIDANLARTITLAEMAKVAGLTRMYFARQFRAATGLRPHEYLLRRRIASAQDMLRSSHSTLVEVALSVGFQAQPHFTTIFKRFVGETPHRWRTSIPGG
jgi:AraC-like DNA-binding protein